MKIKNLFSACILLLLSLVTVGQIPTVREIYNFEINDEFHYSEYYNSGPPRGNRIKVLDKYYSSYAKKLNYVMLHNDYTTVFKSSPEPHLECTYFNYIDTITYTDLDSSILYYQKNHSSVYSNFVYYQIDSTSIFCSNYAYQVNISSSNYEPEILDREFEKDFGLTRSHYSYPWAIPPSNIEIRMNYAKKSTFSCGTPDATGLSISNPNKMNKIHAYPNPTFGELNLISPTHSPFQIKIMNMNLEIVFESYIINEIEKLDLSKLSKGIYYMYYIDNANIEVEKIILL